MIGVIVAALLAGGSAAVDEPARQNCASFYFLYFPASRATVTAGETKWEGYLSDYDPSTALSGSFRLCPVGGRVIVSTVAGDVTVTVPPGMVEAHILIDSQDLPATRIDTEAPLLD
ncbi:MAG: hypothetical protein QME55_01285 [Brevundimonas sp.]|uniref:hypothetical protein n=1 Tax=Brevundimonas sp. TaxID=1871086 RepID=UPI002635C433|nr:hypothetical protein [Brevundimonas sp.]MDI6623337.1 hypothetical protein [Brevundimonas sp.]MDQ7811984.1 hypothetical protein [Brevundimonas sp.]